MDKKSVPRRLCLLVSILLAGLSFTSGASAQSVHLTLGNPSQATTDPDVHWNYLIDRPQYALSYSRDDGIPNWVSWHLELSDLGSVRRSDFQPDTSLPPGWYRVRPRDYRGSGYDRGHMCPSGDRTATVEDNQAVFLMTNILPQAPDNNQGPWERLESYCRELVRQGYELYIISGGDSYMGSIASGRVSVPGYVWKVIVVLPEGEDDLARIDEDTRVIAVRMPNIDGIRFEDWRIYRVTVREIEAWTDFDFLSEVAQSIQDVIENRVDDQ